MDKSLSAILKDMLDIVSVKTDRFYDHKLYMDDLSNQKKEIIYVIIRDSIYNDIKDDKLFRISIIENGQFDSTQLTSLIFGDGSTYRDIFKGKNTATNKVIFNIACFVVSRAISGAFLGTEAYIKDLARYCLTYLSITDYENYISEGFISARGTPLSKLIDIKETNMRMFKYYTGTYSLLFALVYAVLCNAGGTKPGYARAITENIKTKISAYKDNSRQYGDNSQLFCLVNPNTTADIVFVYKILNNKALTIYQAKQLVLFFSRANDMEKVAYNARALYFADSYEGTNLFSDAVSQLYNETDIIQLAGGKTNSNPDFIYGFYHIYKQLYEAPAEGLSGYVTDLLHRDDINKSKLAIIVLYLLCCISVYDEGNGRKYHIPVNTLGPEDLPEVTKQKLLHLYSGNNSSKFDKYLSFVLITLGFL